jgi:hypothetical protein
VALMPAGILAPESRFPGRIRYGPRSAVSLRWQWLRRAWPWWSRRQLDQC